MKKLDCNKKILTIYKKMSEKNYYQRNREIILKRAKEYNENNNEILIEQAKDKYREYEEEKIIKRKYGTSRYHDML